MTPIEHVAAIGQILDALGIPWVLGGSMASSIVGEPRSTMDIDVAIQLDVGRVSDLIAAVDNDYYVSEAMALDAVERHAPFNLIHYGAGMKIDLFPLSDDLLDVRQLRRRQRFEVAPGIELWVGAPDDQVLRKMRGYRTGGEVSDRQWSDVLAILRVQGTRINHEQLLVDATALGLVDLVEQALAEGAPATGPKSATCRLTLARGVTIGDN